MRARSELIGKWLDTLRSRDAREVWRHCEQCRIDSSLFKRSFYRMKTTLVFVSIIAVIVLGAFAWTLERRDRPPKHAMIEEGYFICYRCQSAEGGIFGKGPFKNFRSETASKCVHEWAPVSRDQFKRFAERTYHQDWSKEISFWSQ
jgi:hypothetical protein